MCSLAAQPAELFDSPEDLENFDAKFYEGPAARIPVPEVKYTDKSEDSYTGGDYHKFNPNLTQPLFKKMRKN